MEMNSDKTCAEANIVHAYGICEKGKDYIFYLEGAQDGYLTNIQEHVPTKELCTAVHASSNF
jgi:hypothetical protein